LNFALNAIGGASWVSLHHGGGVGMGLSLHAGMVVVADGTEDSAGRLSRVLNYDPFMGIIRHSDAGYDRATDNAKKFNIQIPMLK
jgi:urocanate hydratase